ncbi:MAG: flagellar basal body L-ring protein FlgH [Campylobacteraceae bacterium]|nr:flagellar basal body L-ring protein FlgH [Campylobacteraceae bacterium]
MKNKLLSLSLILLFTSCSSIQKQEINFDPPDIQIPKNIEKPNNKKGSLYSRKGASLFADKKDLQVGDIIKVIIVEEIGSRSENFRILETTKNNKFGGGIATPKIEGGKLAKYANSFNKAFGFGIESNSYNLHDGSVDSKLKEKFETKISVIILETYQNGNYYIKGSKEMLIDGQRQEIRLSGVIRPYDITTKNTVDSTQIANLKVLYIKDGDEDNVMHVPWGTKILNYIWPF